MSGLINGYIVYKVSRYDINNFEGIKQISAVDFLLGRTEI